MPPIPYTKYEPLPIELFDSNPEPIAIAEEEDLQYARFSKDAYEDVDNRSNFDNYIYNKNESNDKFATYIGDDEIVIGVRGTSSKSKVEDFLINSSIALGSFGGQFAVNSAVKPIQNKIYKLGFDYPKKKIILTGHSQAGSLVSELGVVNPNIEVKAFNRAVGVPFISSQVQCSIRGCNNVKSYRIAGDFASSPGVVLPSVGNTFNLAPKIPDIPTQLEAKTAASFAIPEDMYVAHSIRNFIDRKSGGLIPDKNIYGRILARRLGAVAGIVTPMIASSGTSALFPNKNLLTKIPGTKKYTIQKGIAVVSQKKLFNSISNKLGNLNSFVKYGIAGGIGDYAGLLAYNQFMDNDENTESF